MERNLKSPALPMQSRALFFLLSLVKAVLFSIIKINLIFKRWVEESHRDERNILNRGAKSLRGLPPSSKAPHCGQR
jgi:hypothetical protein